MKILIISMQFWPEPFRITDIALSLSKKGFDVTVLCGIPNLPEGKVYNNYKHRKNRFQTLEGVKIIRCAEIARRNNIFFRLLNYYSFPFFCKKKIKHLEDNFDIVLANELSPIMSCSPALYYKKLHPNTNIIMYEMDIWPESLLCGGIRKDSFIYNHYKKVSSKIYSSFDKILVSTREHISYIHSLSNCEKTCIKYLPQYAEEQFQRIKLMSSIKKDSIDLLFAGNIGIAQSLETILKAANILKDDKRFTFHIVGGGSDLNRLKVIKDKFDINNVIFYGSRRLEEMTYFYNMADVMIVALENKEYAKLTIPGKIQSYMAAGRPILGAISGSGNKFIKNNQIGFAVESEDYIGFANLVKDLPKKNLFKIGKHARECYLKHYSKEIFIDKLIRELNI